MNATGLSPLPAQMEWDGGAMAPVAVILAIPRQHVVPVPVFARPMHQRAALVRTVPAPPMHHRYRPAPRVRDVDIGYLSALFEMPRSLRSREATSSGGGVRENEKQ